MSWFWWVALLCVTHAGAVLDVTEGVRCLWLLCQNSRKIIWSWVHNIVTNNSGVQAGKGAGPAGLGFQLVGLNSLGPRFRIRIASIFIFIDFKICEHKKGKSALIISDKILFLFLVLNYWLMIGQRGQATRLLQPPPRLRQEERWAQRSWSQSEASWGH